MVFRGSARAVIVALVASGSYHSRTTTAAAAAAADEVHIDSAFGVPQTVSGDSHDAVARHMAECNHYMMDVKDKDQDLFDTCKNEHELCTHWALSGECQTNAQEMQEMCGPACKACDPSIHTALVEEEEDEDDEDMDGDLDYEDETEVEDESEADEEDASEGGEEEEEEDEEGSEFEEESKDEEESESADEVEETLAVEV